MKPRGLRNPPMVRADWITAAIVTLLTLATLVAGIANLSPPATAKSWVRTSTGCALVEMAEAARARPCQE